MYDRSVLLPLVLVAQLTGACPGTRGWSVAEGTLVAGQRCGTFVATTNASTTAFSYGQVYLDAPAAPPFELTFAWRRLSADDRSIEVHALGALVLFKDGHVGLWIDDDRFAVHGWRPLSGYRTHVETAVRVVQRVDAIEVWIAGAMAARWAHAADGPGRVGFAVKGAPGARAMLRIADVSVRALDTRR